MRSKISLPATDNIDIDIEDEDERRRQHRIRLGRESFERKRRLAGLFTSSSSASTSARTSVDFDGDIDMEGQAKKGKQKHEAEDAPYVPTETETDEEEEELEMRIAPPRRTARKFTKEAILRENEEERKRREHKRKEQAEIRSRFIEGSMRDRHSLPPPREIIGDLESRPSSPVGDYLEDEMDIEMETTKGKEKEKKKRFTFGLGNIFKFNPLTIVGEARAAYLRQKALHEARERKKEEMKRQKKEAERLYFEMKARGQFKDFSQVAAAVMGSARKRKLGEVASVESDKDAQDQDYFEILPGCDGEDDEDEIMEEYEPEAGDVEEFKAIKYEDTSASQNVAKKPSRAITGVSRSNSVKTTSSARAKPTKGPTKRELQKQERLLKKVTALEEQLNKVRQELAETGRGAIVPAASEASKQRMSVDTKRAEMPLPIYGAMTGALPAAEKPVAPETPASKHRHPNKMLPDTPESTPDTDRYAPIAPEEIDDDTAMDEGFSMIPLSPVLDSSTVVDTPEHQSNASAPSRLNIKKSTGSKSPALSELRKLSGASFKRVGTAISNAVVGGSAESGMPERKKRRGLDSPPAKKGWTATNEEAPQLPELTLNGVAK